MNDMFPPFTTIELYLGDHDAALTIMCHAKRFHICIADEDLWGSQTSTVPSPLRERFLQYRKRMADEMEAVEEFEDWVLTPCIPDLKRLAPPRQNPKPLSLEEYFDPVTFVFTMINVDGRLEAMPQPHDPAMTCFLAPKIAMSERTVSLDVLQGLPSFPASEIEILPEPGAWEEDKDNAIPKVVRVVGTDRRLHFKPALDQHSFTRELDTLLLIRKKGFSKDLHVPRLAGLVIWSDDVSIMGFLLEYIHHSRTALGSAALHASDVDRVKWAQQVEDTVKQLHEADIIWGDVKPDNVLIDEKRDAYVIDFGGGYSVDWVDKELEGTIAGDLQGISRMKEFLVNAAGVARNDQA